MEQRQENESETASKNHSKLQLLKLSTPYQHSPRQKRILQRLTHSPRDSHRKHEIEKGCSQIASRRFFSLFSQHERCQEENLHQNVATLAISQQLQRGIATFHRLLRKYKLIEYFANQSRTIKLSEFNLDQESYLFVAY